MELRVVEIDKHFRCSCGLCEMNLLFAVARSDGSHLSRHATRQAADEAIRLARQYPQFHDRD